MNELLGQFDTDPTLEIAPWVSPGVLSVDLHGQVVNWMKDPESGLWSPGTPTEPQPMDYIGIVVNLEDYMPEISAVPPEEVIDMFLDQNEMDLLLDILVALNIATSRPDLSEDLTKWFTGILNPNVHRHIEDMHSESKDIRLLHRRNILLAMREVLRRERTDVSDDERPPSLLIGILLVHSTNRMTKLGSEQDRLGDLGEHALLRMDVVQNGLFNATENEAALIDRHIRLWRAFGPRVVGSRITSEPAELVLECTGLEIEDILAFGLALYAKLLKWEPGDPIRLSEQLHPKAPADKFERFLSCFACNKDEFRQAIGDSSGGDWDFLPFYQRPILRDNDQLLVLDTRLLVECITTGVFQLVRDYQRKTYGPEASRLWTAVYGEMIELLVRDQFLTIALMDVDSGDPIYLSEEEFHQEKSKGKNADIIVPYGNAVCIVEISGRQISAGTRFRGEWSQLDRDTDEMVIKKARQIEATAKRIMTGKLAIPEIASTSEPTVIPVVISGGDYPVNPVSMSTFVLPRMKGERILQEPYVTDLCVLSFKDLDVLESLCSINESMADLLIRWKRSDLKNMPFHVWVSSRFSHLDPRHLLPERIGSELKAKTEDFARRLGLTPPDQAEGP